ncbi:hypothetical protein [Rhodovulum sulfidophilum]|uniref:hypothetical protein n=1 Tax=Rhodovulum sulfidophilum TaxID=35806 RepID=UPI00138A1BFF|nr:hypothetical protein [Rhodovulum sulfidophilum]NDK36675.1 hypothetical protein [Rhodovulum sulfidophilum]
MSDAFATTRCHWIRTDDGLDILIPMCCGAAIGGPAECTCDVPESRIEAAERGRQEAEAQVLRLRGVRDLSLEEQARMWRENKRLRQRIKELETLLAGNAG